MPGKPRLIGDKDRLLLLEDQDRLLAWCNSGDAAREPVRRFVLLGLQSGLRVSEACRLLIQDCDVDSRPYRVLVRGGKKRTADHVDEVMVPESLALEIRDWRRGRPGDVPLVARQRVFAYSRQHAWWLLKRALRACGCNPKFGFHTLRHRFITTTWLETQDLILTQRQARHRTLDQTSAYIHLAALETAAAQAIDAVGVGGARRGSRQGTARRGAGAAAMALELSRATGRDARGRRRGGSKTK